MKHGYGFCQHLPVGCQDLEMPQILGPASAIPFQIAGVWQRTDHAICEPD